MRRDIPGFWIPAYAGMTVGGGCGMPTPLFSRPNPIVIPAKAGIHPRPTDRPGCTGVLDSGLRQNDGREADAGYRYAIPTPQPHRHSRENGNPHPALPLRRDIPGFWIPAYAGMTVEARCGIPMRYPYTPTPPSFPRKRESTPHHTDTPRYTGGLDSGLRRNDGGGGWMRDADTLSL